MTKPNLFNFATSELSQDAFICWILDHANPDHTDIDPELKSIAFLMINRFLELNNQLAFNSPSDITYLKPIRQYKNIDVLLIVNKYAIIIEDKTVAKVRGKQLQKYTEIIKHQDNEYKNHTHGYIFFKTHDQGSYKKASEDGFKLFSRKDILEIFKQHPNINNDIYQDFYQHIQKLEDDVEAYKTKSFNEWKHNQKIGFLKALQNKFSIINVVSNWGDVPNKAGGFMNLYWGGQGAPNARQYLQLEISNQNKIKLNIRLSTPKQRRNIPHQKKIYYFL